MDISVIIVSYNTKELTSNAIQSVIDTVHGVDYEIIVVDNNSKDGSVKQMKDKFGDKILLVEMNDNLGFSKANNYAMKIAKGDNILLLNSDTIVIGNCISDSLNFLNSDESIGVVGCKIMLKDGTLDKACKRGYPTPWNALCYALKLDKLFPKVKLFGGYNLGYLDEDVINKVDCLMGAFMLLKRRVIDEVGMLDERFFMYGEDIDWCYRISKAGWKLMYYPKAKIYHCKKASSIKRRSKTILAFYKSMILFYNKNYRREYIFLITLFVYLGVGVQCLFAVFKNLFRR